MSCLCVTGRFPTKDILLGQLRAADVNFSDLCKQREVVHQKDTQLQEKDSVIQEKDSVIVQQGGQLEQHIQELQHKDQELQFHREELQQKEAELERRRQLMAYQEQQITSLQLQMQALLAHRRQAGQQAARKLGLLMLLATWQANGHAAVL